MSTGIDYGRGKTNIDLKTGIRYGVISSHEVLQAWAEDSEGVYFYSCGHCGHEFGDNPPEFEKEEMEYCPFCGGELEWEDMEPIGFKYDREGYEASQGHDDPAIFILESPFYTLCRFCSPCAPGAGDIMASIPNGIKAYCFGHDWFEKMPTGKMIDCPYCDGTGTRLKVNIPGYLEKRFIANGGIVCDDHRVQCWDCQDGRKTGQIGKVEEMRCKAPYPVYDVKTGKEVKP